MAVAYRDVTQFAASGDLSSWTINVPAGVQNGDKMLLMVCCNDPTGTISALSGWTQFGTDLTNGNAKSRIYWRDASGEPSSYSQGFTVSTEGGIAIMIAYSGAASGAPHKSSQLDVANTTTPVGTAVLPTLDNCMIVALFGGCPATAGTGSPDTSPVATERADIPYSASQPTNGYAEEYLQGAQASIALDATMTQSAPWNCYVVALAPAAGGTEKAGAGIIGP